MGRRIGDDQDMADAARMEMIDRSPDQSRGRPV
jgi:hypothetical protein